MAHVPARLDEAAPLVDGDRAGVERGHRERDPHRPVDAPDQVESEAREALAQPAPAEVGPKPEPELHAPGARLDLKEPREPAVLAVRDVERVAPPSGVEQ